MIKEISKEQRAHDLGIAFATAKLNKRLAVANSSEKDDSTEQFRTFCQDYSVSSSLFIDSIADELAATKEPFDITPLIT